MPDRPQWAAPVFDEMFELVMIQDNNDEYKQLGELVCKDYRCGIYFMKILESIKMEHDADEFILMALLSSYYTELLSVLGGINITSNFTTGGDKKRSLDKILKACDVILDNVDKVGCDWVQCYSDGEDFSDLLLHPDLSNEMESKRLIVHVLSAEKFIREFKDRVKIVPPSILTKVSTRDAKFNFFCREMKKLNEKWLGRPYWDCMAFFAFNLVPSPPETADRITAVRNACGLGRKN